MYCDHASINPNSLATDPASTNCYAAAVKTVLGSSCLDLVVAAADPAVPIHCYPALRSTTHQDYDLVPDAVPEVLVHTPSLFSFGHPRVAATQVPAEARG